MRILHIMLSKEMGGIQQAYLNYTQALGLKNHNVHMVTHPQAAINAHIPPDLPCHFLPNFSQNDPFAIMRLALLMQKLQPDLVLVHGVRAALLAKRARWLCRQTKTIKMVAVCHNYHVKHLLSFEKLLVLTEHMRQFLLQKLTSERVFVLPNMITLPPMGQKTANTVPVIGAMGRFVRKKGFHIWIESLALLKKKGVHFTAILAGDGPEKEALMALIAEFSLQNEVQFIGWVQDKDAFFNQLDLFICPSLHEPFGIVLLEAMARLTPIITTASEGPSEIITPMQEGRVVPIDDATALAEAQAEALLDAAATISMAKTAYDKIQQHYILSVVAEKLDEIIRR